MILLLFSIIDELFASNGWVILSQVIAYLILIWFFIQSVLLFYEELHGDHAKQGARPVMALLYMLFSIVYIFKFINNFGLIISFNENRIRNILRFDDQPEIYIYAVNILTAFVLIAFTFNFCKAFHTLNLLEFGTIGNAKLKDLIKSGTNNFWDRVKPYAEAVLRLAVAFAFILVEKKLVISFRDLFPTIDPNVPEYTFNSFLWELGWLTFGLYTFLQIWLLFLYILKKQSDSENVLSVDWYKSSLYQFIGGIVMAGFILFFGWNTSGQNYKVFLMIFLLFGIFASFVVIYQVSMSEYKRLNSIKI